jgi:hypothetical protein
MRLIVSWVCLYSLTGAQRKPPLPMLLGFNPRCVRGAICSYQSRLRVVGMYVLDFRSGLVAEYGGLYCDSRKLRSCKGNPTGGFLKRQVFRSR